MINQSLKKGMIVNQNPNKRVHEEGDKNNLKTFGRGSRSIDNSLRDLKDIEMLNSGLLTQRKASVKPLEGPDHGNAQVYLRQMIEEKRMTENVTDVEHSEKKMFHEIREAAQVVSDKQRRLIVDRRSLG